MPSIYLIVRGYVPKKYFNLPLELTIWDKKVVKIFVVHGKHDSYSAAVNDQGFQ